MMDIKGLFVWTLGSVIQMIQLISKLKKHFFCTFQSLRSWPIRSRVITVFLQLLGSRGSLVFYLVLVSISFVYASRNPVSMGLRTKHKLQKADTYKHNQTYKRLVRMLLQSVTQWLDQLDHQVHLFVYHFLALLESTDQWYSFPNK